MNADDEALESGWAGPRRFDDFEVLRPLGRGGMGQVFLGRDVALDRPVALKFTASSEPSEGVRARFLREARAIARLTHPNVVGIYRVGEVQGRPYIAYEYVSGRDLESRRAALPWAQVARVGLGAARGLVAAHEAGVLHRDIKPGNVMLTDRGEVKLIDFGLALLSDPNAEAPLAVDADAPTMPGVEARAGIARLTLAGTVMGTPAYIPPEVWLHERPTARSDLYALALVLYRLLTATLPHDGADRDRLARSIVQRDAPPVLSRCPDALPSFAALIDACLARDPERRPASAAVMLDTLERICAVFAPSPLGPLRDDPDFDPDAVSRAMRRALSAGDVLVRRTYERLFAARPDLRSLFPRDLDGQRAKLRHALELTSASLHRPEQIAPLLRDLGRRHAHLSLGDAEYRALGDALVGATRDADPSFDRASEDAFRGAYAFIVETMREGAEPAAADRTTAPGSDTDVNAAGLIPEPAPAPEPAAPTTPSSPGAERPPPTRYAYCGELGVAYQVFGAGRRELMLHLGRVSHLDYGWRHPTLAGFLRALGSMARVIAFDRRGAGLSERAIDAPALQHRLEDPLAVLDAANARRVVMLGVGEGAASALFSAAVFPERVSAVVCVNGSVKMLRDDGYDGGLDPAFLDAVCERIRRHWGEALFADAEAPSMSHDEAFRDWFGEYLRSSTTPGQSIAQLRLNALLDGRPVLPFVRAPVLVVHRADDRLVPASDGRYIADHVPDGRFVSVPGGDHLPFTGDAAPILDAVRAFLDDPRLDAPPAAPLVTYALLRADAPDAPLLHDAAARAAALGLDALPSGDPCARVYASRWFNTLTDFAASLALSPGAASQGARAALDADVAPPLDRLARAAQAAAPGQCLASRVVSGLAQTRALVAELDRAIEVDGARFAPLARR
ncbi:MAG: alpha/beta fold hydrolase [Polyangiales bacterium]